MILVEKLSLGITLLLDVACAWLASQMKGVTVEGNGYGVLVCDKGAVGALEGCTVRANEKGDYGEVRGGRIE